MIFGKKKNLKNCNLTTIRKLDNFECTYMHANVFKERK